MMFERHDFALNYKLVASKLSAPTRVASFTSSD